MQKLLQIFLVSCAAVGFSSNSFAATAIGQAVSVDDTVTGSQSRRLSSGTTVFANERINANASGLAQFELRDGSKLVVGPGSKLVLDSLIYSEDSSKLKKFAITAAAGAVRFISGSSDSSAYQINTPVGTLGLRGTAFDLHVFGGRAYLMMAEGAVEFCSNSGSCRTVSRKCDYIVVDAGGNISDTMQPRTGLFNRRDLARIFPFIANQGQLQPSFRLRTQLCGGNGGGSAANGDSGASHGEGSSFGGGSNSRGRGSNY